jgi:hypothetical protein
LLRRNSTRQADSQIRAEPAAGPMTTQALARRHGPAAGGPTERIRQMRYQTAHARPGTGATLASQRRKPRGTGTQRGAGGGGGGGGGGVFQRDIFPARMKHTTSPTATTRNDSTAAERLRPCPEAWMPRSALGAKPARMPA